MQDFLGVYYDTSSGQVYNVTNATENDDDEVSEGVTGDDLNGTTNNVTEGSNATGDLVVVHNVNKAELVCRNDRLRYSA